MYRFRFRASFVVILLMASVVVALYVPFLNNGLVFDDHGLFDSGKIYDHAIVPFDFRPRTFPYFTLGAVQVITASIAVNRLVSLGLHITCCVALFFLLSSLFRQVIEVSEGPVGNQWDRELVLPAIGSIWFAVHPIAVYGAAYLAQRTILFATLFSLLSLLFFLRSFREKQFLNAVLAALTYSLAVLSKEHAITLPLIAIFLSVLKDEGFITHLKALLLYLIICVPAACSALFVTKHIVATGYEPEVDGMILGMQQSIPIMIHWWGKWLVSIVMQTGFFFDYLRLWFVPDVRFLSADMRVDFVHIWVSWWSWIKATTFFAFPLLALYGLRKKGSIALFSCGALYAWILFLTELAAVRFQEPFVLYRSYLWAPGYAMMLIAVCSHCTTRKLAWFSVPLLLILMGLARERLSTFESDATLWSDAAKKLGSGSLVGSERIFYNRGNVLFAGKLYLPAIEDYSSAIKQNPKFAEAYYNRALAFYANGEPIAADADVRQTLKLDPGHASAYYTKGFLLQQRNCINDARTAYAQSAELGNWIAKMKLSELGRQGSGNQVAKLPDSERCKAE